MNGLSRHRFIGCDLLKSFIRLPLERVHFWPSQLFTSAEVITSDPVSRITTRVTMLFCP